MTTEQVYDRYLTEAFRRARVHVAVDEAMHTAADGPSLVERIAAAFRKEWGSEPRIAVAQQDGFWIFHVEADDVDEQTICIRKLA